MAITSSFTSESTGYTWAVSNKSDSHTTLEPGGGSPTYVLGAVITPTQSTSTFTPNTVVDAIGHLGTWVTPLAPEAFTIPAGATFAMNNFKVWEGAGNQNSYLQIKISIVTESGGVLSWGRTLMDWWEHPMEPGTSSGSSLVLGGVASTTGVNYHYKLAQNELIQSGESIAVEIAMITRTNKGGSCNIDFGDVDDTFDSSTLAIDAAGTGPYGTSIGFPVNFTVTNRDAWGEHHEVTIPKFSGTNLIAWADIGSDWSTTKWENVSFPAKRYTVRQEGQGLYSFYTFQDDDYVYLCLNNHEDGCIQSSDHMAIVFGIEAHDDWRSSLEPTNNFYEFRRDIQSGTSLTQDPILPVAVGDNNDGNEYILRGDPTSTYPDNWEVPTLTTGFPNTVLTFSGAEAWTEGVDYRMGGPGATSTFPAPTGIATGKSYSEWKISKSKLGWNGTDPIAFMVHTQCDTQVKGHCVYPPILGLRVDLSDWNYTAGIYESENLVTFDTFVDNSVGTLVDDTYLDIPSSSLAEPNFDSLGGHGATFDVVISGNAVSSVVLNDNGLNYEINDTLVIDATLLGASSGTLDSVVATVDGDAKSAASGATTIEVMDMRPIMMGHAHAEFVAGTTHNPTETVTGATTTSSAALNMGYRPSETVTGATTSNDASVSIGYRPTETITGVTTTNDANIGVGMIYHPTTTITGATSTQDAQLDIGYRLSENFVGVTSTNDAVVIIGHRPFETITGVTTTTDASLIVGHRPTETITGATTTTDAQLDIGYSPTETITGATSTSSAGVDVVSTYNPSETITGATSTSSANISSAGNINPSETITGVTTTNSAGLDVIATHNPTITITAVTSTQDALIVVGHHLEETIIGATSTNDAVVIIGHRPTETIIGATTTNTATVDMGRRPTETIIGATSTIDASLIVGHRPFETITGATSTSDADIDAVSTYNPSETITGATSTSSANIDLAGDITPTVDITGATTTNDADIIVGHFVSEAITGTTSTNDAVINFGHFPTVTVTSITSTQNAIISIGHRVGVIITSNTVTSDNTIDIDRRPTETITGTTTTTDASISVSGGPGAINPTATFPVYSRVRFAKILVTSEEAKGAGGIAAFPSVFGPKRETHEDALKKRKLPTVKVLEIKTLNEIEKININIDVLQVTDLLMEDV